MISSRVEDASELRRVCIRPDGFVEQVVLLSVGERVVKVIGTSSRESMQGRCVTTEMIVDAEALIRIRQLSKLAKER